jgi:hypothetical protein
MFKDDDECIFYYEYNYDNNNQLKIVVQRTIGKVQFICYIKNIEVLIKHVLSIYVVGMTILCKII